MKKILAVVFIFLFISQISVSNSFKKQYLLQNNILYVGGSGPGNYSRIQDAINDAMDGDTIIVYPGNYKENIVVYKSLKIVGISYPAIFPEDVNKSTIKIVIPL